ncbi:hypothetical protein [Nocardia camponoti]|uniref:Uncharacterized protein n=1 Tax=Nocardia camponoti TaxID=1616106 RepID=A0A917Q734_9NOCA|nr:hypothetical protein [Nocardia camponoti]GGK32627.1 hypothetical protein GCM10011591_00430 [Nocardia camponoti]
MGSLEDEIRKTEKARARDEDERLLRQAARKAEDDERVTEFRSLMRKHRIPTVPLFVEDFEIEFQRGSKWFPDIWHYQYTFAADMWTIHTQDNRGSYGYSCVGTGGRADGKPKEVPAQEKGFHYNLPPGTTDSHGRQKRSRHKVIRVRLDTQAQTYASQHNNHLWVIERRSFEAVAQPPSVESNQVLEDFNRERRLTAFADATRRLIAQGRSTDADHKVQR